MLRLHAPSRLAAIAAAVLLVSAFSSADLHGRVTPARVASDTVGPKRPRLDDTADTRDWRSYFQCAMNATKASQENACLYWAERLDREVPETPYLRFLLSRGKDTAAETRALELDPFFFQTRIVILRGSSFALSGPDARGWEALQGGQYGPASAAFAEHLAKRPADLRARWGAAVAHHYAGHHDSSATQLGIMLFWMRQQQAQRTANYHSLDFIEFARATALLLAHDTAGARNALEASLTENFGSWLARMTLADIAMGAGDTARASEHWTAARELGAGDVVVRARYARFLTKVRRFADAERELAEVIAAEPHWASVRRDLAIAIDSLGAERRADAIRAYEDYLARAPREPAPPRAIAESRLAALKGGGSGRGAVRVPDTP